MYFYVMEDGKSYEKTKIGLKIKYFRSNSSKQARCTY